MKYLVFGAGAIGSVFAGLLCKAGEEVHLVGRQSHVEAIKQKGLSITGIWGEHHVSLSRAYISASDLPGKDFDVIFLSVKSYDTGQALRQVAPYLRKDGMVVSLQNGLGNVETLAGVVGAGRTVGGRVIFGVEFVEPGSVKVTVYAEPVMFGSPGCAVPQDKVRLVVNALNQAGIPSEYTTEIEKFIWAKALYNVALNPLSTLLGVNYGFLLENEYTPDIMRELIDEAFCVASAIGQPLFWETPGDYMEVLFSRLIPLTAAHHPSMLQDIRRGKRTEIDSLNGALVRMGEAQGVKTLRNALITRLIKSLESRHITQK